MPSLTLVLIVSAAIAILAVILFLSSRRGTARGEPPDIKPEGRPAQSMGTTIGKGMRVEGRLAFVDSIRVDGTVTGEIDAPRGTLTVGPDGHVKGKVAVGEAILGGEIAADVTAQRLELLPTARVSGALSCTKLRIHDGACLDGRVSMQRSKSASSAKDGVALN
jgi:cytoskeletal protein CcmA (bactofilin family)